jgi:hypothetical protein
VFNKLLRRLQSTGLRRGFNEGSRVWMVVGVSATLLRLAGRVLENPPELVYRTELEPGETLEINTRRRRRGSV